MIETEEERVQRIVSFHDIGPVWKNWYVERNALSNGHYLVF